MKAAEARRERTDGDGGSSPPVRVQRLTRGKREASGLPWILPAFLVVVGVIYYSLIYTGYISSLDWDGLSPDPDSVGVSNYQRLASDAIFWASMRHTVILLIVTFSVQTVIGLTLAVLLHSRVWFSGVYKTIVFIPVILAPAIMAPVFRQIFSASGQLNSLLETIGLGWIAQPWLAQESTALLVIMAATVWQWTGLTFILYLAAIAQIEPEMVEAARIDGAGNLTVITRIIWPSVRGTTLVIAVLSVIGSLKTFDWPHLISRGGPNYATEFLGTYIYRLSIPLADVGYAASISIVLLMLALTTGLLVFIVGKGREGNV